MDDSCIDFELGDVLVPGAQVIVGEAVLGIAVVACEYIIEDVASILVLSNAQDISDTSELASLPFSGSPIMALMKHVGPVPR